MVNPIRIVSATRTSESAFYAETHLGRSLTALLRIEPFEIDVSFENRDGLPIVYNRAILRAKERPALLVFVHDDVYFADTLWIQELRQSLTSFDIVGLAGNRRRVPKQPSWAFGIAGGRVSWDAPENLSGMVGHGDPPGEFNVYGRLRQQCQLLDGLLLAAQSTTLIERELAFDPRFSFHFYDLDFCRQAELRNLKMGTAAIKVIHKSGGSFGSEAWRSAYQVYLDKYGE